MTNGFGLHQVLPWQESHLLILRFRDCVDKNVLCAFIHLRAWQTAQGRSALTNYSSVFKSLSLFLSVCSGDISQALVYASVTFSTHAWLCIYCVILS